MSDIVPKVRGDAPNRSFLSPEESRCRAERLLRQRREPPGIRVRIHYPTHAHSPINVVWMPHPSIGFLQMADNQAEPPEDSHHTADDNEAKPDCGQAGMSGTPR